VSPLRAALAAGTLGLVLTALATQPAPAASSALAEFAETWSKITDYSCSIKVHETSGGHVQDRVYEYAFKKPHSARIAVVEGPGKGSGATWHGGTTVVGHQGGILSMIHLNVDIHDGRATSLRGDTIDSASFGAILDTYAGKGEVSESAGPVLDDVPTDIVTLNVSDPQNDHGITRDELWISRTTHLPVHRLRYEGALLVKDERFYDIRTNTGLDI